MGGPASYQELICQEPFTPRLTRAQSPQLKIDEAPTERRTLRNNGSRLIPPQFAVNFFADKKFEAEAIEPPCTRYLVPNLQMKPESLPDAGFKPATENDVARRKKFGARRTSRPLAQLFFTRMRFVAARESAGALESFNEGRRSVD